MKTKRNQIAKLTAAVEGISRTPVVRDTASEPRTDSELRRQPRDGLVYRLKSSLMTSPAKSAARAMDRMAFPIMGFVGPNGGGKTLAAVEMAMIALGQGRRVLSTCPLLDPSTGEPHPLYVQWHSWDQLLDWWDGDVFADEVLSIAGARAASSLDPRAQTLLVQLRKRNSRFWWTAPSYQRADLIIREVTQAITECRGFYADRAVRLERRGAIQSWAPKRLFSFKTYDSVEFDEWTTGRRDAATPLITEWFKGPGSAAFASYDTLGAVDVIASVNESGICQNCNGTVSGKPKPCRCAHPVLVVAETVPTETAA